MVENKTLGVDKRLLHLSNIASVPKTGKDTLQRRKDYILGRAFYHRYMTIVCYHKADFESNSYEESQMFKASASAKNELWLEMLETGSGLFKGNFYEMYEKYEAEKLMELLRDGIFEVDFFLQHIK